MRNELESVPPGATKPCPPSEIIDSDELARRWNLPASWIREQVRSRALDPIPHLRFGRYVRFAWNDPALLKWLERRRSGKGSTPS
jgi:hypothetical protein